MDFTKSIPPHRCKSRKGWGSSCFRNFQTRRMQRDGEDPRAAICRRELRAYRILTRCGRHHRFKPQRRPPKFTPIVQKPLRLARKYGGEPRALAVAWELGSVFQRPPGFSELLRNFPNGNMTGFILGRIETTGQVLKGRFDDRQHFGPDRPRAVPISF